LFPLQLNESILEVKDLKVNLELCKKEFARDWEAAQTGRGFINDVVPANFSDFLIGYAAAKVAENIEFTIWQGDTTVGSTYPGFNGFEKTVDVSLKLIFVLIRILLCKYILLVCLSELIS